MGDMEGILDCKKELNMLLRERERERDPPRSIL